MIFLLVASWRLFLVYVYGQDSPYSDQWDAEGWTLLRPLHAGRIDWSIVFSPHNEHRIALVRLASMALFALNNDQWDNLVGATASVLFVAISCALVFRAMLAHLPRSMWPVPACLLAACCLPYGHENLLVGFQLGFYLLLVLAALGAWLAASRAIDVKRTLLLGSIAYASLFSLASGMFTPIAIAIAVALRIRATSSRWLPALPLFAILVSAVIAGQLLMVGAPQDSSLRAQDFSEWLRAMSVIASWPFPASWISPLLLWSPTAIAVVGLLRKRDLSPAEICAFAIAAWTAAQIAGIAYGRAHDIIQVHSRYTDILAFAVLVNVFFCMQALHSSIGMSAPRARVAVVSLWLTMIAGAYGVQGAISVRAMLDFAATRQLQSDNVRLYVSTGNAAVIDTAMPWNLPYPNKARLKMMLDDGTMRDMLPAGVRKPLSLGGYNGGFSVNGMPSTVAKPRGQGAYGSYALKSGADNTAVMTSGVVRSRFPYLQFAVAGFPGSEGVQLELKSGGTSSTVAPASPPGEAWKEVAVAKSSVDFSVSARDDSHTQWLAFAPPVEIGRLSQWTRGLLAASPFLLFAVLAAICFLILFTWLIRAQAVERGNNTDSGSPAADAV